MGPRIERAMGAFNDHDPDGVLEEFADSGTFTDPLLDGPVTGAELREYTAEIIEAFPDVRLEVERVIASDEGVTAIDGTYVGTHTGPIEGIPPTGRSAVVPTVTVIDVSDEGIIAWRDYWDQQTFSEQLGLTIPATVPLIPRIAAAKVKEHV